MNDGFERQPGTSLTVAGLTAQSWAVIFVALAVATLPAVMPVMVGAMAQRPDIGISGAGYIVSVNMGGMFLGTLSCFALTARYSTRQLLILGLVVMTIGNIATILMAGYYQIIACRALSGWGEGVAAALCYTLMARAIYPSKAIAFYAGGQAIIGAIGMAGLPMLVAHRGWQSFYVFLIVAAVPALFLSVYATKGTDTHQPARAHLMERLAINRAAAIMLVAIILYFSGLAAIWAFMEPIGQIHNLAANSVSFALSASAIAGFAASLSVGLFAHRLSDRAANGLSAALVLAGISGLFFSGFAGFFWAVCLINIAWGFEFPFLFKLLSEVDRGGATALTPLATGLGLMIGPAIGGILLQTAGLYSVMAASFVLAAGGLMLAFITIQRRSAQTARAELAAVFLKDANHAQ